MSAGAGTCYLPKPVLALANFSTYCGRARLWIQRKWAYDVAQGMHQVTDGNCERRRDLQHGGVHGVGAHQQADLGGKGRQWGDAAHPS